MIQSLPMSSGEISPSQGQQHRPFIRLTIRFHDPRAQALVIHLVAAVFLEQFSVERAHVGNENHLGTDSHGLSGRAPHNLVRDPMDRVASRLPAPTWPNMVRSVRLEIGRESCRERDCQTVWYAGVA